MIRNWYNQIPHPALNTKREITKYINWRQFTKGTRGKPNEQLFPQSDQSLRYPQELWYPLSAQQRLIRLGGFQGWSESSLVAQIILLVLSWSGSFYVGHQSYQINHILCSKNKSSIQKLPAVCLFSNGTVCRTLRYYFMVAREKVRIVVNHRQCPRAMFSRYNVWNILGQTSDRSPQKLR